MSTNNMIKSKLPQYSCFWICSVDAQIIDWIYDCLRLILPYEPNEHHTTKDAKSNNAVQDDEQHNVALRRWNHEEKKTWNKKLDVCENHLFRLKERRKKMQRGDSKLKID